MKPKIISVDAADIVSLADRTSAIGDPEVVDTSDIPETDFSRPDMVRGKYFAPFVRASGLVQLDPDLRKAFPDDASVNRILRRVLELARELRDDD